MLISRYSWRYFYYLLEGFLYRKSNQSKKVKKLLSILHSGPLLIVCNGPSLREIPLDKFQNIQSIGLNKIHLIFDKTTWRPNLILAMNRHVVSDWQDNFLKSGIPTGLAWQARYKLKRENRSLFTYYLNQYWGHFGRNIAFGLDASATVTYSALQFAYLANANPVILVGLDHRFTTKGIANKLVKSREPDTNHFDPRYFGPGKIWNLPDLEASEKAFKIARYEFEKDNRKIYDATIDGNLNIFEKISLEEAIRIANK